MFRKPPQDSNPPEPKAGAPEIGFPSPKNEEGNALEKAELKVKSANNNSEVVSNVEKISRIISPYFIAIVGLLLYEDNFLIGIFLIALGILSLLKISWKDVANFWESMRQGLGLTDKK